MLTSDDWETWRTLRLQALAEAPYAFGSRLEDWVEAPESRWRERLRIPGGRDFVALAGGTPAGMATGIPDPDPGTVMLISMYVAPDGRGRGVGDALIRAVEGWAVQTGARRLCLAVRATNDRARRAYERNGLTVTGEVPRTAPDEPLELRMCKDLRPLA